MLRYLLAFSCFAWFAAAANPGSSSKSKVYTVRLGLDSNRKNDANQVLSFLNIGIGTPPQSVSFILSTVFPQIAVADSLCVNCGIGNRFQWKLSSSFQQENKRRVGDATGLIGMDAFTLSDEEGAFVSRQTIFVVENDPRSLLGGVSGVLGLTYSNSSKTSFVQQLKEQQVIPKAVVALYFGTYSSWIMFGGWDLNLYATRSAFTYVDLREESGQWAFPISSVNLGSTPLQALPQRATINTTSPSLIVPQRVFEKVKELICRKVSCVDGYPGIAYELGRDPNGGLFNLTFVLSDQEMTIPSEFFMKERYRRRKPTLYFIAIEGREGNEWVLGLPFLRRYYVLLDFENARLGFAPAKTVLSSPSEWIIWPLAIGVVVVLMIIGIVCLISEYGCCCKKNSELSESLLDRQ